VCERTGSFYAEPVTGSSGCRELPENAHVRILSGSVVPDGSQGWLAGPGASHRAHALPGEIR